MIKLNVCEAVSHSWDLNKIKPGIVKLWLAAGAVISSFFSFYEIELSDVCARVNVEEGYDRSYLVRSLKNRNVKIETPSISLLQVPDKFKDHYKILIEGYRCSGKSLLINSLRGLKRDDEGFIKDGGNEKVTFTELGNNIVLCEMASNILNKGYFKYSRRYEGYDAVIFMTSVCALSETDVRLMRFAQDANKPYWVVRSHVDIAISNYGIDVGIEKRDDLIEKHVMKSDSDVIMAELNKHNLLPSSGKPFIINGHRHDKYDLKELTALVKEKGFSGGHSTH